LNQNNFSYFFFHFRHNSDFNLETFFVFLIQLLFFVIFGFDLLFSGLATLFLSLVGIISFFQ